MRGFIPSDFVGPRPPDRHPRSLPYSAICAKAGRQQRTPPPVIEAAPLPSFPRKRESRRGGAGQLSRYTPPPPLDSRFRGNDGERAGMTDRLGVPVGRISRRRNPTWAGWCVGLRLRLIRPTGYRRLAGLDGADGRVGLHQPRVHAGQHQYGCGGEPGRELEVGAEDELFRGDLEQGGGGGHHDGGEADH